MKVLITSGGTEEAIDGVRSICNFSSGRTAATIADFFQSQGVDVVFLHNEKSIVPKYPVHKISFLSFKELDTALKLILNKIQFNAVIHAAAVSDYSIDYIQIGKEQVSPDEIGKIDSNGDISIVLKKNFKIIDRLKSYNLFRDFTLVGFKLTNTKSNKERRKKITEMFEKEQVDFLVHNDIEEIEKEKHIATIFKNSEMIKRTATKHELARELYKLLVSDKKIHQELQ